MPPLWFWLPWLAMFAGLAALPSTAGIILVYGGGVATLPIFMLSLSH